MRRKKPVKIDGMQRRHCRPDEDVSEPRPHAAVAVGGDAKEVRMKALVSTVMVALSFAAITAASASTDPTGAGAVRASGIAAGRPAPLLLAGPRRRCTEDLGYGRTGSYGCG